MHGQERRCRTQDQERNQGSFNTAKSGKWCKIQVLYWVLFPILVLNGFLLFACLEDMRQQGFGYAIIGGVGPAEFYAKAVGAVAIDGSEPGIYRGLL